MDYDDDSRRSRDSVDAPTRGASSSYQVALAIWLVPPLLAAFLMLCLNLRTYESMININYGTDDFLEMENRTGCGWPYVLASVEPATRRWRLNGFGIVVDGIILLAAAIITGATTRFIAAFVDYDVNRPIQKQVRGLLQSHPRPAAKRSRPNGPARARRRYRPPAD